MATYEYSPGVGEAFAANGVERTCGSPGTLAADKARQSRADTPPERLSAIDCGNSLVPRKMPAPSAPLPITRAVLSLVASGCAFNALSFARGSARMKWILSFYVLTNRTVDHDPDLGPAFNSDPDFALDLNSDLDVDPDSAFDMFTRAKPRTKDIDRCRPARPRMFTLKRVQRAVCAQVTADICIPVSFALPANVTMKSCKRPP
ncbi:hypothetical protein EVAR_27992_1 [Eumeta japonica]|uniref:Uncharacterized protein n=1 Tax=Eumeta variegata TaxID=151549 RepID=A0A4C1WB53_EUMVA|nr:hypothetical protein EVAR_27992_1 [Eumeta japonica]